MTRDEAELLVIERKRFHDAFSKLVNTYIRKCPGHLQEILEIQLAEIANVYNRNEEL